MYNRVKFLKLSSNQSSLDTIWNEHIQDEFFGVHFGATKKELLRGFAKYGIICNYNLGTNTSLSMVSNQGKYFSFGDINWKPRKIAKAAITTAEIPAISLLRDPLDLRL